MITELVTKLQTIVNEQVMTDLFSLRYDVLEKERKTIEEEAKRLGYCFTAYDRIVKACKLR